MMTSAQPAFSRRDFLNGGVLIVGFNIAGPLTSTVLGSLAAPATAAPPDPELLDSWIAVHADNTATVFMGKVELGQGTTTGMLQIAAEELDLAMSQVSAARIDTDVTPNQGPAVASLSIMDNGPQLRAAAAEARQALLRLAAARLNAPADRLSVKDGVVVVEGDPGRTVTYGDLIGDRQFNVKMTGKAQQKPVSQYRLVTTRVLRVDIPEKVSGKYVYMQHVHVPGMLHGRIVRPRGQGAMGMAPKSSVSTQVRFPTSRAPALCAGTTWSVWLRSVSGMRCGRPRSSRSRGMCRRACLRAGSLKPCGRRAPSIR
jgi:nicotinate dehydrogenase subunit B